MIQSIIGKTFKRNSLKPNIEIRNIPSDVELCIGKFHPKYGVTNIYETTSHRNIYPYSYYITYYQLRKYYTEV